MPREGWWETGACLHYKYWEDCQQKQYYYSLFWESLYELYTSKYMLNSYTHTVFPKSQQYLLF